ncbi:MAG: EamA family transporter [Planctomycetia bacterium]|nr:EamA family transporter [Planctomycetia bacterium]
MWLIYALLSALFAALTAIFAKIGVHGIDSNLATAVRTVVILALAWLVVLCTGKLDQIGHLSGRTLLFLVLSGLATGASWLFYFKALQLGDVSRVAPIDKLSVVVTMLLAFCVLQEVPTAKTIVGGLLVTLGAVVLAF